MRGDFFTNVERSRRAAMANGASIVRAASLRAGSSNRTGASNRFGASLARPARLAARLVTPLVVSSRISLAFVAALFVAVAFVGPRVSTSLNSTSLNSASLAGAAEPGPATEVDFARDILPLLKTHCFRCHAGRSADSGVRLDLRREILGETSGMALAVPGKSGESRLVELVTTDDAKRRMPPEGEGERLGRREVELLRNWIDRGLPWDERAAPETTEGADHWAFQSVQRAATPSVERRDWLRTSVDSFVAAKHQQRQLISAPPADRRRLARRLSLDLIGEPPDRESVEMLVEDEEPDAVARYVDRLLASPRHGQRWGRHWLDIARWAETEGYESNHPRPYAWRYRDYVVDSMNGDLPYDQFLRQQIAGDEMTPYDDRNLIATGFIAAARLSSNEEDKLLQRNAVLVDVVNALGEGVLGLTIGCAQCHNHKLDPLTLRDYYRLQALFVQGQPNNLVLQDPAGWKAYHAAKPAEYDPAAQLLAAIYERARTKLLDRRRAALSAEMRAALELPVDRRSPQQQELARQADLELQVLTGQVERELADDDKALYEALKKKVAAIEKTLPDKPQTWGFYSPVTSPTSLEVLPMKGFYPLVYDAAELRQARGGVLIRGDVHRRGGSVDPGWPEVLEFRRNGGTAATSGAVVSGTTTTGATSGNAATSPVVTRSAFVDWLVDPRHPLTARVWVNRLWQHHFGRGIVATPGDFGLKGAPPSHPELLDHLALELIEGGWSTKRIHREIVLSATYGQDSRGVAGNESRDPDNELLWRWRPRRLEAEAIRDSLIVVADSVDRAFGGKSDEEKTARRRSLYVFQKRDQLPEVQRLFDGANGNECCSRRHVSTVALQPLYLLNSPHVADWAKRFARRVFDETRGVAAASGGAASGAARRSETAGVEQIELAYQLALSRLPTASEKAAALDFLRSPALDDGDAEEDVNSDSAATSGWTRWEQLCHMLLNLNEFLYVP